MREEELYKLKDNDGREKIGLGTAHYQTYSSN